MLQNDQSQHPNVTSMPGYHPSPVHDMQLVMRHQAL